MHPPRAPVRRSLTALARGLRLGLKLADDLCASVAGRKPPAGGSLVTLLFHELYRDAAQCGHPGLAPNQEITTADFERLLGVMTEGGYIPVTPDQVAAGLAPWGHYFMVTFDDGYFNNVMALDVLARFHVPGTFFITSDPVAQGKSFWWDALARELRIRGASEDEVRTELRAAKRMEGRSIESSLRARFGEAVLRPRSDLDRPFRPLELRDFANNRWVHLGNHTSGHAILTQCGPDEVRRQIADGQQALADMTGRTPVAIAYPNGDYSRNVMDEAAAQGLRLGFTVRPHRAAPPCAGDPSCMALGRFLVAGTQDMQSQYRKINAKYVPGNIIKSLLAAPTAA